MYVCVCLAVTDTTVREAIQSGCHNRSAVTRACGAGGDCGACHGMIESMVEDHLEQADGFMGGVSPPDPSGEQLIPDAALVRTRAA